MSISASDVKDLRDRTGAGMMDCKKALAEANGDMDLAVEILRKKGQKVSEKRADREANEGTIVIKLSDNAQKAVALALNCETDFVARNEDFIANATGFAGIAFDQNISDVASLLEKEYKGLAISKHLDEMVGKIGEKIEISKLQHIHTDGAVVAYTHPGNKLVVLVEFAGAVNDVDAAKDVAMQVAAMRPIGTRREDVPSDTVQKEIEIAKEQLINEGKPADIAEKAAMGKLRRFYEEYVLLEQKFVKDNGVTVEQYIKSKNLPEVRRFVRIALGEA